MGLLARAEVARAGLPLRFVGFQRFYGTSVPMFEKEKQVATNKEEEALPMLHPVEPGEFRKSFSGEGEPVPDSLKDVQAENMRRLSHLEERQEQITANINAIDADTRIRRLEEKQENHQKRLDTIESDLLPPKPIPAGEFSPARPPDSQEIDWHAHAVERQQRIEYFEKELAEVRQERDAAQAQVKIFEDKLEQARWDEFDKVIEIAKRGEVIEQLKKKLADYQDDGR